MLENIRIVLVGTTHPGNIGATARAMKNMGLRHLYLVAPKVFPHVEATARAAGADEILAKAVVVDNVDAALVGCNVVMGTSARERAVQMPLLTPRECAQKAQELAAQGQVALVFGRESSGLSNAELQRCNFHVHIPTVEEFSSLNLAAAVQVIVYELYVVSLNAPVVNVVQTELATADAMEQFYQHLFETLVAIKYMDPKRSKTMMQRLRRLFNRATIDQTEIKILRGILSAMTKGKVL
ncbi:MAG: RNA methyltransferase [Gammaproteobacteria bacterium]|nr:RNA methyltransferase [Gammaproteobacteria bacterium]